MTRRPRVPAAVLSAIILPCAGAPNCVSSTSSDPSHRVAPIACVAPTVDAAVDAARAAVQTFDNGKVTRVQTRVVHAEFTSHLLRFVDDVVLVWDEPAHAFQVLSASRRGMWDFGVNRRRVEKLRDMLTQRCLVAASATQPATEPAAGEAKSAAAPPAPADAKAAPADANAPADATAAAAAAKAAADVKPTAVPKVVDTFK
jgi:uncharacterized protein (DUF1499 family)